MQLSSFDYHRPASLAEACALGARLGPAARFLAGGTDLLVDLKTRRFECAHLIALDRLRELRAIRVEGDRLHVGALATMSDVAGSAVVREAVPALAEAVLTMGAPQVRNRATVGGNFCAAVPCADTPPVCLVSGATLRLVSATSERTVPADAFFLGPRRTLLAPGEILAEIVVPVTPAHAGAAYVRFARRRHAALAVAGAAAYVALSGRTIARARVALTAVAPVPMLVPAAGDLLEGREPTPELLARAALAAAGAARPISDLRAGEGYRRELVATLSRRALEAALARAERH